MEGIMKQNKLGRRLLLFPTPFHGHLNPMLHLATLLHSKGFSITIIQTPYNPVDPTYFPHFTFTSFYNSLLESYSKSPPPDSFTILSVMDNCSELFRDCLSQILCEASADADKEPIAALITDPVWKFAVSIAASFNLPRMVLRTGSITSLLVYSSLPNLREKGYFPPQDHTLDKPIPEFPPLKVRDLPPEWIHELLEALTQETKTSQGVICNTFEELEDSLIAQAHQILPIPIFPIGPLHKHSPNSDTNYWAQDTTSIAWLNNQEPKSVLYVSFGSVAAMNKDEFLELAWGLLDSMVPFLWVVRPGLIQGLDANNDSLPEGYLEMVGERGHIVTWAPQLQVLSHPAVGGFWTHNGWNSTLESICEGVPMLCQPILSDQNMNARHVSDGWRIGLKLQKGIKREEIAKSIRKLMLEEGEEMRNRITALKQKANLCVKEGGSSYMSLERLTGYLLSF